LIDLLRNIGLFYPGMREKRTIKALRLQANQYAKQNRAGEARCCYEQIRSLEIRFDVNLLSTGDENRLEKYREKDIAATEPKRLGN